MSIDNRTIGVSVKVDVSKAMRSIKEFPREGTRAMVSALNRTLAMANTASRKEIQSVYSLKAKDFKYKDGSAKVAVQKASASKLFSSLYIRGTRLGLYLFAAKNTKVGLLNTKENVSRVTVEVKRGHRFLLNRAFISSWRKGDPNKWVMETDKSAGKTVERISSTTGKTYKAYPRKALFTISLPEMYRSRRIAKVIKDISRANFERIFKSQFLARIKGFVKVRKAA